MEKKINFRITGVDLLEAVLNTQDSSLNEDQVFRYDIRLEHKQNVSDRALLVVCEVTIENQEKTEVYGRYKAGCVFQIDDINEFVKGEEGRVVDLPSNIIVTLNSVTISTVRGMMASFYRGTYLHDAILPLVDPTSFQERKREE